MSRELPVLNVMTPTVTSVTLLTIVRDVRMDSSSTLLMELAINAQLAVLTVTQILWNVSNVLTQPKDQALISCPVLTVTSLDVLTVILLMSVLSVRILTSNLTLKESVFSVQELSVMSVKNLESVMFTEPVQEPMNSPMLLELTVSNVLLLTVNSVQMIMNVRPVVSH